MDSQFTGILQVITRMEVEALQLHPRFKALKLQYAKLNKGLADPGLPIVERKGLKKKVGQILQEVERMLSDRLLPKVWAHPLLRGEAPDIEERDPVKEVGYFNLAKLWELVEEITDMLPPGQDTVAILQLREFMFSTGGVVSGGGKLTLEIDPRLPLQVLKEEIGRKVLEYQKRVFGSPVSGRLKLFSVPPEELEARVKRVLFAYRLRQGGKSFPQIAEALGLPGGREDTLNFLKARRLVQKGKALVENGVFNMLGTQRFFYKLSNGD